MSGIKLIALDIYDTVLCADDLENAMPPRIGLVEFIRQAKARGIKVVTSSDADLTNLKLDLEATFRGRPGFSLDMFDGFYRLAMKPKDYSQIISDFGIQPEELLIVGDHPVNDCSGAPAGASLFLVPPYTELDDKFNFMMIPVP